MVIPHHFYYKNVNGNFFKNFFQIQTPCFYKITNGFSITFLTGTCG